MLLYIEAKPNAHKNELIVINDSTLKIRIAAKAIDGEANKAIIKFLSEQFSIPKSTIQLVKGATNKFKCFEINANEEKVKGVIKKYGK